MTELGFSTGPPVMAGAPTGAPYLSRHAHLHPADGICLMEWVSQQAGEPFTDSPHCTHPLLAHIARIVNDALEDGPRQQLATRAPRLIGTTRRDLSVSVAIMHACVQVATDIGITSARLQRATRRAGDFRTHPRPRRRWLSEVADALYRRGPAQHLLQHIANRIAALPKADRSATLVALLDAAIDAGSLRVAADLNPSLATAALHVRDVVDVGA